MSKHIQKNSKENLIQAVLYRGVAEIINAEHLEERLRGNNTLRVKFGVDPTAPDIHLGHTIPLMKIRQFQELGHTGVIIIGDYTASIGDPSGKDKTRPPLSLAEVKKNSAQYKKQILKILRKDRTEFHFQSEWFKKFGLQDALQLASHMSVSQLLAHETFRSRLDQGKPFMMHEMFYPLLQGYDSLAIKADVEVGGLDQKFNLLTGRTLQKHEGMEQQDIVMTPYLLGGDGQKMSKSLGNYIGINDAPEVMYGKVMAISDNLVASYFELLTAIPQEKIANYLKDMNSRPVEIKKILAHEVTQMYWGEDKATKAGDWFQKTVQEHAFNLEAAPVNISSGSHPPLETLEKLFSISKSEAKRLIEQKGVFVNDKVIEDWRIPLDLKEGDYVRIGKRRVVKVHLV